MKSIWKAPAQLIYVFTWPALVIWTVLNVSAAAQTVTTTVSDTLYAADGTAAQGTIIISWPAFATATGQNISKGSLTSTLDAGGALNISLMPNANSMPAGTYYTVVYHFNDGSMKREYWIIPVSTSALRLSAVRAKVLPSSVAMESVTKEYVDQAIARGVNVLNVSNPVLVPAGGGEYPMMDGSGNSVADVSGNGNTLNFCAAPNSPSWYSYGLSFLDAGTLTGTSLACLNTPFSSFKTVYFATISPTLIQNTGTGYSGLPFQTSPTVLGRSGGSGSIIVESQSYVNAFQPTIYLGGNTTLLDGYGGAHVFGFTCGTGSSSLDHWVVDGQEPSGYQAQGSSCAAIPITGGVYQVGTLQNQVSNAFRGVMTYMIVYPEQHTVAQMQAVEKYIQARLSARAAMPIYPNRTTSRTPQFIALGDSLTASYQGTSQWTASLSLNNSYQINSYAIYANTAYDMCKMGDQSWAQSIVPGRTVLHLWAGTNDFSILNKSASDIWTSLTACGMKAKQMGARTIIATMPDRGGAGNTFVAKKNALNTLIRTGWKTSSAFDALNDIAGVAALGADGASANTSGGNGGCFYSDSIHLMGPGAGTCATLVINGLASALSGYGLVGQLVSNAVNTLDGSSQTAPDLSTANTFIESFANNFIVQTPSAAATHTLVDCQGQGSVRTVVNGSSSYAITIKTVNSQTIIGNATVTAQSTATFTPMLLSASTGGCTWLRTQ